MDLEITCTRCKTPVSHTCNPAIKQTLLQLYLYAPEYVSEELVTAMKASQGYEEGDEKAPFFSERFLYPLLGKDDARTVLAYLHNLQRTIGLSTYGLRPELRMYKEAQETVARCHGQLWDLAKRMRQASKEELGPLREEKVRLMDEQLPAQRLVDKLDRYGMEIPEAKPRAAFLDAVSKFASNDELMASLQDMDTDDFEDALKHFFGSLTKNG